MIASMVEGLADRLAAVPDDLDGWEMLIRSYAILQRPDEAQQALLDGLAAFEGQPDERRRLRRLAANYGLVVE